MSGEAKTRSEAAAWHAKVGAWFSSTSPVLLVLLLAIMAAVLAVAGAYKVARESDVRFAEERSAALRAAIGEFRMVIGEDNDLNPRFEHMFEQVFGLKNVAFRSDPPAAEHDMLPVVNARGRIIGFLTWQPEQPMTQMTDRLAPLIVGIAFALASLAGLFLWRLLRDKRPVAELAEPCVSIDPTLSGASSIAAAIPPKTAVDVATGDQEFIRRELPGALKAQLLEVHYQPILASAGGAVTGVEALLRWTDKNRGAISPATFVPVAERMGLVDELGRFVLRRALQDAKNWPDIYVSVNLSPLQAREPRIVEMVRQALQEFSIAPKRLVLEITEGVLIDNPEEMLRRIEELRAIGVRIALDDFGSGYSSLGYLQRFAFDKLKIDRSFVSVLGRSPNAAVIIQAVVALGRALGVTVVVEGVETEEQRVLLRLAGCDEMQGFLFARPAPAGVVDRLIASKQTKSAA